MKMLNVVIILASLLAACQFDPYSSEYTEAQPSKDALVGTYKPDERSQREFMNQYKVDLASTRIRLNADDSFTADRLPDCWREFSCSGRMQSVSGTWSVDKHQDWWGIHIRTRLIDGKKEEFASQIMLRGEQAPYIAHFIIGDPDSGEALAFEKERAN